MASHRGDASSGAAIRYITRTAGSFYTWSMSIILIHCVRNGVRVGALSYPCRRRSACPWARANHALEQTARGRTARHTYSLAPNQPTLHMCGKILTRYGSPKLVFAV